jgi:hypothetical protein
MFKQTTTDRTDITDQLLSSVRTVKSMVSFPVPARGRLGFRVFCVFRG